MLKMLLSARNFQFDLMKFPAVVLVLIICNLCSYGVSADNSTGVYRKIPSFGRTKHEPKFFSFNTDENGELNVDLEFAVPFISIPVKRTIDAAMGLHKGSAALANINLGSVLLAGGMVFGAVVIIPLIASLFFKNFVVNPQQGRSAEHLNDNWRFMTYIDQTLIDNNIDAASCLQRTMCWLAQNARNKLNSGKATSQDKILDGLMTNYWVNQLIEGSAMQSAIQIGLENNNCAQHYWNCKIDQNKVQTLATNFAKIFAVQ